MSDESDFPMRGRGRIALNREIEREDDPAMDMGFESKLRPDVPKKRKNKPDPDRPIFGRSNRW